MIGQLPMVAAGDRIRFMGVPWTISGILYTRDWRPFLSLVGDHGEVLEFIACDGSDGPYELLEPATGEGSGHAAPGDPERGSLDVSPRNSRNPRPTSARSLEVASSADLGGPARPHNPVTPAGTVAGLPLPTIAEPIPDRFNPQPWRP